MSIVNSLGRGYCNEWLSGALFLYDGKPHRILEFRQNEVVCVEITEEGNGPGTLIPNSWFTGFGKLAYPPLGYRRVNGIVLHLTRRQSAHRGLRINSVAKDYSPLSWAIVSYHDQYTGAPLVPSRTILDHKVERAIMLPEYDSPDKLPDLLAGDIPNLVLNENILIEMDHKDAFSIYYKTMMVGHMDRDGNITAEENFSSFDKPVYKRVV